MIIKLNKMKINLKILILLCVFIISCKPYHSSDLNIITVEVKDLGKICLDNEEKHNLSQISKINKKFLTSSIYCTVNNVETCLPINDKTFDYNYWYINKDKILNKKVEFYCKNYSTNKSEIKIIYKLVN